MVTLIHMLIPPKQLNQWHGFWAGLHLIGEASGKPVSFILKVCLNFKPKHEQYGH